MDFAYLCISYTIFFNIPQEHLLRFDFAQQMFAPLLRPSIPGENASYSALMDMNVFLPRSGSARPIRPKVNAGRIVGYHRFSAHVIQIAIHFFRLVYLNALLLQA